MSEKHLNTSWVNKLNGRKHAHLSYSTGLLTETTLCNAKLHVVTTKVCLVSPLWISLRSMLQVFRFCTFEVFVPKYLDELLDTVTRQAGGKQNGSQVAQHIFKPSKTGLTGLESLRSLSGDRPGHRPDHKRQQRSATTFTHYKVFSCCRWSVHLHWIKSCSQGVINSTANWVSNHVTDDSECLSNRPQIYRDQPFIPVKGCNG